MHITHSEVLKKTKGKVQRWIGIYTEKGWLGKDSNRMYFWPFCDFTIWNKCYLRNPLDYFSREKKIHEHPIYIYFTHEEEKREWTKESCKKRITVGFTWGKWDFNIWMNCLAQENSEICSSSGSTKANFTDITEIDYNKKPPVNQIRRFSKQIKRIKSKKK